MNNELDLEEIKEFLDQKYTQYNQSSFIESDPISIPHLFSQKKDQEIAGFLAATIAWGQRKAILKSAHHLMECMDHAPYDFVMNYTDKDLKDLEKFVYRTFQYLDLCYFLKSLRNIYEKHQGLENVFTRSYLQNNRSVKQSIIDFYTTFFELPHEVRTHKHVANPKKGSAAKRINMYLRWMVRNDQQSVDFGLWKQIATSDLYLPIDVHAGNVSRKLGLLARKQTDWKAVEEVTQNLRLLDPKDPVKYDYALFGLGVFEKF